jgi:glycosyltransferase involved in cell wall biosynthesis
LCASASFTDPARRVDRAAQGRDSLESSLAGNVTHAGAHVPSDARTPGDVFGAMTSTHSMADIKVEVFHNIRWSRYKARVFSALHSLSMRLGSEVRFTQIADTEGNRTSLSAVDLRYHEYPHSLLFDGNYEDVGRSRLAWRLFRAVFHSDARLVVIPNYSRPEHWAMLAASRLTGKATLVVSDSTLRDHEQIWWKGALKRLFFSLCDGAFCYGRRAREHLEHYGMRSDAIFLRCQAAALPDTYSVESALRARIDSAGGRSAHRFLYVGRLSAEKSLDCLIDAFAVVQAKLPTSELVLVGGGDAVDQLRSRADAIGLTPKVRFVGGVGQSELAHWYASATCLVLPSRSEPWGLVVNEALHYGCPVVASDNCGCVPELVIDGKTGFVFETDNVEHLAATLLLATETFRDASSVAERCLAAIETFTPERSAQQMMDAFCQLLSARR